MAENTNEDFLQEIERIKSKNLEKKRLNSKGKGNRAELKIAKILTEHFGEVFRRTPGSGAFTGGVNYDANLREDAVEILSSDIVSPPDFAYSIESKSYNQDSIRINHFLTEKDHAIDTWWLQCSEAAEKAKKKPMLIVRLDRSNPFCLIKYDSDVFQNIGKPKNFLIYMNNRGESILIITFKYLLDNCNEKFWGIRPLQKASTKDIGDGREKIRDQRRKTPNFGKKACK